MSAVETVEQEIQRKGLTAPRVTPADLEANIASARYFTADDGCYGAADRETGEDSEPPAALKLLTMCVLVLRNGFTVIGTSACASPENFDAELGRKIARADAVRQVWPLMGYALRERLHNAANSAAEPTPEQIDALALELHTMGVNVPGRDTAFFQAAVRKWLASWRVAEHHENGDGR